MKKKILLVLALIASLGLASCDKVIPTQSGRNRGTADNSGSNINLPDVIFEPTQTSKPTESTTPTGTNDEPVIIHTDEKPNYDEIPEVNTNNDTIAIDDGDYIETDAGNASVANTEKGKYLTANPNIGYDFIGWYLGDKLLSTELKIRVDSDAEKIAAKFEVKDEFKDLIFTSTPTSCSISGVKESVSRDLVLPEGITKIEERAFSDANVAILTLPESLTEIEDYAFANSKLMILKFKSVPSKLGYDIDYNSKLKEIVLLNQEIDIDSISRGLEYGESYYNFTDTASELFIEGDFVFVIDEGYWTAIAYLGNSKNVVFPEVTFPEVEGVDNKLYDVGSELFKNNLAIESVEFSNSIDYIWSNAFYECENLKTIKFSNSVSYIGYDCFNNCDSLTEVIIPKNVTEICESAFYDCDNLKAVSIGDNGIEDEDLISIGEGAFSNCDKLLSVSLGYNVSSIGYESFANCGNLKTVTVGKKMSDISNNAFYGCNSLNTIYNYSSLNIEKNSTENGRIGYYANNIVDLSSQIQQSTIGKIEDFSYMLMDGMIDIYAYNGSDTDVVIPSFGDKPIVIGYKAFEGNQNIKSVTLNDNVLLIDNSAFKDCSNLTTIDLKNVKEVAPYAFANCIRLTNVSMPKVESIYEYAFQKCHSIFQLELPESLSGIATSAFDGCARLVEVIIKSNVSLPTGTYYPISDKSESKLVNENGLLFYIDTENSKELIAVLDKEITKLTIDETVTDVHNYALFDLNKLEELTTNCFDETLGYYFGTDTSSATGPISGGSSPIIFSLPISGYPISSTTSEINVIPESLRKITLLDGVDYLSEGAFKDCSSLKELALSKNITSYPSEAFENTNIEKFYFNGTVKDWCNIEITSNPLNSNTDIYFMIDDEYQIISKLVITSDMVLDDYRFEYFNMEEVEIAEGITSIGKGVFEYCKNLKSVVFPTTIESIGDYAFAYSNLEKITIPEGLTYLGDCAFAGTSIKKAIVPGYLEEIPDGLFQDCYNLQYVKIEEGITNIGYSTFSNCRSLYTLVLPTTLKIIAIYAFDGCENLETVSLVNTEVTALNDYVFANCKSLVDFEFPTNITYLSSTAFEGCDNFTPNTYDNGCYVGTEGNPYRWLIKARAKTIISCNVHPDCEKIFTTAFKECAYLKKITIPAGCTDFEGCLSGLMRLEYVEFPYVGSKTFSFTLFNNYTEYVPSSLKTVVVNNGSIPKNAFVGVTSIKTFKAKYLIENDTFKSRLESIGETAFKNCTSLETVDLGKVTTIGKSCFDGCVNADFIMSDELVTVGESAFKNSGITSFTAGLHTTGIGNLAFEECKKLVSVDLTNFGKDSNETYGSGIFSSCLNLTEVTLPTNSNINYVGTTMFYGCTSLESISFPNNITRIWNNAFRNSGIKTIDFNKVNEILKGAFRNSALESLTIPSGMKLEDGNPSYDYHGVFEECSKLATVIYNSNYLYAYTFKDCTNLKTVTLSSSLKTIGDYMFINCTSLTTIDLSNITTIKAHAFDNTALTSFVSTGAVELGDSAFANCKSLETVSLTNDAAMLKTKYPIGSTGNYGYQDSSSVFAGCSNLSSVTLPSTITYIPSSTFMDCTSLAEFDFTNIKHIYHSAFKNTGFTSLTIPSTVLNVLTSAFENCTKLETLNFYGKFVNSSSYMGNDYEYQFKNCTALKTVVMAGGVTDNITGYAFADCTSLDTVTFSDNLTIIRYNAFENCNSLEAINIPSTLTGIADNAFENTGLIELTIPENVSVGSEVFKNCSNLGKVIFNGNVTSDSTYLFSSCPKINYVELGENVTFIPDGMFCRCTSLNSIELPTTITSIGNYAFDGCTSLKSIVIPASVTNINSYAFGSCSGLTHLEYLGSVSDWENITKGSYIFSGAKLNGEDVTTIKCSDGNANI